MLFDTKASQCKHESEHTCLIQHSSSSSNLVLTGTTDEHGCIPSAGYTWCEKEKACIKPWEKGLGSEEAIRSHCTPTVQAPSTCGDCLERQQQGENIACQNLCGSSNVVLAGTKDKHGCIPSAGYTWCESEKACIKPWEKGLGSEDAIRNHCTPKDKVHKKGNNRGEH